MGMVSVKSAQRSQTHKRHKRHKCAVCDFRLIGTGPDVTKSHHAHMSLGHVRFVTSPCQNPEKPRDRHTHNMALKNGSIEGAQK